MKRTLTAVAVVASVLALGACSSTDDDTDAAPTSTTSATTTAAASTTKAAAAVAASDPRCAAAEEQYTIAVANGLQDKSLTLQNAQMIVDGDLVFYGASTVRPDGKFENRSDVWVIKGMLPTSSTGGARSSTEWTKTSDTLQIQPSDERVQAVDTCVVNATRG